MTKLTRREFARRAAELVGCGTLVGMDHALARRVSSVFGGVQIGVQTNSFSKLPLEKSLEIITQMGINSVELAFVQADPFKLSEQDFKQWRHRFDQAGVKIASFIAHFRDEWSDGELEKSFWACRAMGVRIITCSVSKQIVSRLDRLARKYKIRVGLHNHWFDGKRPDQFESAQDFLEALKTGSEYLAINLDVGHFSASGYDPVTFIREHQAKIVSLHIKDRKNDPQRTTVPLGEGDTPIVETMRLLKRIRFRYAADIEHEVPGQNPVEGVKQALEYLKRALA